MFRSAGSSLLRRQVRAAPVRVTAPQFSARTLFSSTAKPAPRRFRSTLLRFGIAAAGTYYYFSRNVFAEETEYYRRGRPIESREVEEEDETKPRNQKDLDDLRHRAHTTPATTPPTNTTTTTTTETPVREALPERDAAIHEVAAEGEKSLGEAALTESVSPEELEEEAGQQGAFNPETGEINWDCPCLGGMAHGPCGPEFRDAFSCFIYSTEEPKGVDCIDKFKVMQECFRRYPELYGNELEEENAEDAEGREATEFSATEPPAAEPSTAEPSATTLPAHPDSSPEPQSQLTVEEVKEKVREEVPKETEAK